MLYKNYEIFKDDLSRTCIYNTDSRYSKDSDHIVVNGNAKDAKQEIDNRVTASQAASALGKLGGSVKSEAKSAAVRKNGKLGGRPKKQK